MYIYIFRIKVQDGSYNLRSKGDKLERADQRISIFIKFHLLCASSWKTKRKSFSLSPNQISLHLIIIVS